MRSSRATWGGRRKYSIAPAETLEQRGDRVNAAHARYLEVRRLLLIGRIDQAESALAELDPAVLPPALRTAHELVVAGIAIGGCGRRRHVQRSIARRARRARHVSRR